MLVLSMYTHLHTLYYKVHVTETSWNISCAVAMSKLIVRSRMLTINEYVGEISKVNIAAG